MKTGWTLHENKGGCAFLTAPLLEKAGVKHLFSTRLGGVSEDCFSGWNFAVGAGEKRDDPEKVLENYRLAAELLGGEATDVCRTYQTHTALVISVDEKHRGVGIDKPKFGFGVDGLVTETPGLLLSVRSADCVPILLYDPVRRVCGAVHSGWRGTAAAILRSAVAEMEKHGCKPENILAAIGPCIGKDCYEVGGDLLAAFTEKDPSFGRFFAPCGEKGGEKKYLLDLVSANEYILAEAGVKPEHITASGLCTHCFPDLFFSHRRSGAERGTMTALIRVP